VFNHPPKITFINPCSDPLNSTTNLIIPSVSAGSSTNFNMEGRVQWINSPSGPRLNARVYEPTSSNDAAPYPVIILAIGLGTIQQNRTISFVQRFADAGYASVTFDYATWGQSEGEPRHTVRPNDQYRDVCSIVAWVRQQHDIFDPTKIVIWGTSFGGLHVTRLLAEDSLIAAGITQCPCVDAAVASRMKPFTTTLQLGFWGILDTIGSYVGAQPIYVAVAKMDDASSPALMEAPDVVEGYGIIVKMSPGPLKNRLTARSVLSFPLARPALLAAKIVAPFLIVLPKYDTVAPIEAAREVAAKARNSELVEVPGGHFDVYEGKVGWDENINAQLAFLKRHVPTRGSRL
jgi:pimeloyl-ACP methyl ester carboxylesterase